MRANNRSAAASMPRPSIITPRQLRAARGYMAWDRVKLSGIAGVSPETIKNIEQGVHHPNDETIDRLLKAFDRYNVRFFNLDFAPPYVVGGVMHFAVKINEEDRGEPQDAE
jgi:transcriptional regulator with XRE-family HTH domain